MKNAGIAAFTKQELSSLADDLLSQENSDLAEYERSLWTTIVLEHQGVNAVMNTVWAPRLKSSTTGFGAEDDRCALSGNSAAFITALEECKTSPAWTEMHDSVTDTATYVLASLIKNSPVSVRGSAKIAEACGYAMETVTVTLADKCAKQFDGYTLESSKVVCFSFIIHKRDIQSFWTPPPNLFQPPNVID